MDLFTEPSPTGSRTFARGVCVCVCVEFRGLDGPKKGKSHRSLTLAPFPKAGGMRGPGAALGVAEAGSLRLEAPGETCQEKQDT